MAPAISRVMLPRPFSFDIVIFCPSVMPLPDLPHMPEAAAAGRHRSPFASRRPLPRRASADAARNAAARFCHHVPRPAEMRTCRCLPADVCPLFFAVMPPAAADASLPSHAASSPLPAAVAHGLPVAQRRQRRLWQVAAAVASGSTDAPAVVLFRPASSALPRRCPFAGPSPFLVKMRRGAGFITRRMLCRDAAAATF